METIASGIHCPKHPYPVTRFEGLLMIYGFASIRQSIYLSKNLPFHQGIIFMHHMCMYEELLTPTNSSTPPRVDPLKIP